jgi:subfamily B ATP-binding cassette protein MsbA
VSETATQHERDVLSDVKARADERVQRWTETGGSMLAALRQPEGKLFLHYLRPRMKLISVIGVMGVIASALEALRLLVLLVTLALIVGETPDSNSSSVLGFGFDLPGLRELEGTSGLMLAFAALAVATLLKEATELTLNYLSARLQSHFMYEVRRDLLDKLLILDSRYFTETKPGDLAYLQNTIVNRFSVMVPTVRLYIQAALDVTVAVAILAFLSAPLTLLLIVLGAAFFGFTGLFRARTRRLSYETENASREAATQFLETVHGIRLVKLGGQQGRVRKRYLGLAWDSVTALTRQLVYQGFAASGSRVGGAAVLLLLAVGLNVFADFGPGAETGAALGFLAISLRAVLGLGQLIDARLRLTSMIPHFIMIADFLLDETHVEPSAKREMPRLGPVSEGLAAEQVAFRYVPERPVLEDVSLEFPRGTITALIGPSGSGKTTLLELMAAFRTPESGRILVDGRDLAEHDAASYREQIGYVTQDPIILHDTLRSNVTFLRPDAGDEEIDRALDLAEARAFVGEHGLDAVVGERGAKISGGQRQRIALSRVLLQDPPVLLLDEATNALDLATEARVFDNLLEARGDKVVVVAAHRLSALTRFDNIVVLHQGRVVEQGSHAQLLAARGFYYHLFGLQEFAPEATLDSLAQL